MSQKLLEVTNLSMHYDTLDGNVDAVKNVSFTVNSGDIRTSGRVRMW